MALPLPPGLTPPEVAFLCEMENVTIVPRQKLDSIELLAVRPHPLYASSRALLPPYRHASLTAAFSLPF